MGRNPPNNCAAQRGAPWLAQAVWKSAVECKGIRTVVSRLEGAKRRGHPPRRVPISPPRISDPNPEVKPSRAQGTARATAWKSRSSPGLNEAFNSPQLTFDCELLGRALRARPFCIRGRHSLRYFHTMEDLRHAKVCHRTGDSRRGKVDARRAESDFAEVLRCAASDGAADPVGRKLRDRRQDILRLPGSERGGCPGARAAGRLPCQPYLRGKAGD